MLLIWNPLETFTDIYKHGIKVEEYDEFSIVNRLKVINANCLQYSQ
jgi:hypothetical protein